MDPAQLLLFVVITVLTIMLIVIGVQVFYILRDFRKTLTKVNRVMDDAEVITSSVKTPITSISSIVSGIQTGKMMGGFLRKMLKEVREVRNAP